MKALYPRIKKKCTPTCTLISVFPWNYNIHSGHFYDLPRILKISDMKTSTKITQVASGIGSEDFLTFSYLHLMAWLLWYWDWVDSSLENYKYYNSAHIGLDQSLCMQTALSLCIPGWSPKWTWLSLVLAWHLSCRHSFCSALISLLNTCRHAITVLKPSPLETVLEENIICHPAIRSHITHLPNFAFGWRTGRKEHSFF